MNNLEEVQILNSEQNQLFWMYMQVDKFKEFLNFLKTHRNPSAKSDPMPGVSGGAALALNLIFTRVPEKFPLTDLIHFLSERITVEWGIVSDSIPDPAITKDELEDSLTKWRMNLSFSNY